jgi:hypothetical protein
VRAQEARALSAQLQARRDIALAEAAYLRVVTIPAGELAPPVLRYQLPTTIDIAVATARTDNSRVLLLPVDETLARERAAQSAGLLQPRVDLVVSGQSGRGVDYYRAGLPSPSSYGERGAVMLQVTVPLYPGPGDFARLRQDREQVLARIAEQGNAGNRAAEDASVAMARLITARQLIDVAGRAVQAQKQRRRRRRRQIARSRRAPSPRGRWRRPCPLPRRRSLPPRCWPSPRRSLAPMRRSLREARRARRWPEAPDPFASRLGRPGAAWRGRRGGGQTGWPCSRAQCPAHWGGH